MNNREKNTSNTDLGSTDYTYLHVQPCTKDTSLHLIQASASKGEQLVLYKNNRARRASAFAFVMLSEKVWDLYNPLTHFLV